MCSKIDFKVNESRLNLIDVCFTEPLQRLRAGESGRTKSFRRSFRSLDFARRNGDADGVDVDGKTTSIVKTDLPLAADVLNSLTSLCFPG